VPKLNAALKRELPSRARFYELDQTMAMFEKGPAPDGLQLCHPAWYSLRPHMPSDVLRFFLACGGRLETFRSQEY
jgi:hypothetical protein